MGAPNVDFSI